MSKTFIISLIIAAVSTTWTQPLRGQSTPDPGLACVNACLPEVSVALNALQTCDQFFTDPPGSFGYGGIANTLDPAYQLSLLYCLTLYQAGGQSCAYSCLAQHGPPIQLPSPDRINSANTALYMLNYMAEAVPSNSCPAPAPSLQTPPQLTQCEWDLAKDHMANLAYRFNTGYEGTTVPMTQAHVEDPATQFALIGCESAALKDVTTCQAIDCPAGDGHYQDLCRSDKASYCYNLTTARKIICQWSAFATAAHAPAGQTQP